MARTMIAARAWCETCDWEVDARNGEAVAGQHHIHSVAVPALGVGLGGLRWTDVLPLIKDHLTGDNLTVEIYPPR